MRLKQLVTSEAMTSQTDKQTGNLCIDFLSSIVCHTFKKVHNFLNQLSDFTKISLLCFSCFSASTKNK